MVKHYCDRCKTEIEVSKTDPLANERRMIKDYELCDHCLNELSRSIDDFVSGNSKSSDPKSDSSWHNIRLGYPSITGVYLVAIRNSNNGYSASRLAKYNNGSYGFYKLGKYSDRLIEEDGGEVVAWAEIPAPFEG